MRVQKHRKKKLSFISLFIVILALLMSFTAVYVGLDTVYSNVKGSSTDASSYFDSTKVKDKKLNSKYVSLLDMNTGKIILDRNGDTRCYPASLTKIMTAIIAIENNSDIYKNTSIDSNTISTLAVQNASMAGYWANEYTTIEDLLYASILASGADASLGLANATSGSESSFVDLMNKKAKELNMSNTNFTNVTGLHDSNHYSTTNDLIKLLNYALNNPTFKEIFTSASRNIRTDTREFTVRSTFFTDYSEEVKGLEVKGAKTGTTNEAGSCLASYVTINGNSFILVTTHAPINESGQPKSFEDLNYVFKKGIR